MYNVFNPPASFSPCPPSLIVPPQVSALFPIWSELAHWYKYVIKCPMSFKTHWPLELSLRRRSEDAIRVFPECSVSHANIQELAVIWQLGHTFLIMMVMWGDSELKLTVTTGSAVTQSGHQLNHLSLSLNAFNFLSSPDSRSILGSWEHDKHVATCSQLGHFSLESLKSLNFCGFHHYYSLKWEICMDRIVKTADVQKRYQLQYEKNVRLQIQFVVIEAEF